MKDLNNFFDSPVLLKIGFHRLFEFYESWLTDPNPIKVNRAKELLSLKESLPYLNEGTSDLELLEQSTDQLEFLLEDLFPDMLGTNEIKAAGVPYRNYYFKYSSRFKNILNNAGNDFELTVQNIVGDDLYIVACTMILQFYYGYEIKLNRPFFYQIPDQRGIMRHYKLMYNADFTDIIINDGVKPITQEDFEELIDNFHDVDLWREKFPPRSYTMKGFIISNLFDVTQDQSVSNFKSNLIGDFKEISHEGIKEITKTFQSLMGIPDIEVGFSEYIAEEESFQLLFGNYMNSFLLNKEESKDCHKALCDDSYESLVNHRQLVAISDVDRCYKKSKGKNPQCVVLYNQGYKSALLVPIAEKEKLIGVLELVSKTPKVLNSVTAQRLEDVMPFIVSALQRAKREEANLIEAIIQQECTAIHPSVHWKFKSAARKFIHQNKLEETNPQFDSIKFDQVYPLFGQIDIQGSSEARNTATKKDLCLQLRMVEKLIINFNEREPLPIFNQILNLINKHLSDLETEFRVDSEQQILKFLKEEIDPILIFQKKKYPDFLDDIDSYFQRIDPVLNIFYVHRKSYDETVSKVNFHMADYLDGRQVEAQAMYPHYFERFKTDGVEHNMYIGEAITREESFNKLYLYNLRLWQLQVMVEMENEFYRRKQEYPLQLDVASMILVYNQPLSIHFRMDEKQFDVDGTYNARYQVVKKRVDKAFVKGTNERLTQNGKIAIVYSQKEDETEYLEYIKFLQSKNYLNDTVEILELEDLQGITGLKAIRVGVLYHKEKDKEYYSYEDLMDELKN